ncbi:MAG: hypothetical protein Q8P67_21700 [archaeon]|nr:hypothetical protein [archaeon]
MPSAAYSSAQKRVRKLQSKSTRRSNAVACPLYGSWPLALSS